MGCSAGRSITERNLTRSLAPGMVLLFTGVSGPLRMRVSPCGNRSIDGAAPKWLSRSHANTLLGVSQHPGSTDRSLCEVLYPDTSPSLPSVLSGPFQETFDRLSLASHPWISGKPRRSAFFYPAATHSRVRHPCRTAAHCFAALDWVPACGQLLCLCAVFPTVVSQIHPSTVCSRLSFTRVFCSTLDIFFNIEAYDENNIRSRLGQSYLKTN